MLLRYVELGGVMMWPLLVCSVLLAAVLVERVWTVFLRYRVLGRHVEPDALGWHHLMLRFFVDIPPSIGLLGTVIGVVRCFRLTDGRITAESAAAGLGVACFTTIAGLSIALIASVSWHVLDWVGGQHVDDVGMPR